MKVLALVVLFGLAAVAVCAPQFQTRGFLLALHRESPIQQQQLQDQQRQQQLQEQQQEQQQQQQYEEQLRDEAERRRVAEQLSQQAQNGQRARETIVLVRPGVTERVLDANDAQRFASSPVQSQNVADQQQQTQLVFDKKRDRPESENAAAAQEANKENNSLKPISSTEIRRQTVTTIKSVRLNGKSSVSFAGKITTLRTSFVNVLAPRRFGIKVSSDDQSQQAEREQQKRDESSPEAVKIVTVQVKSTQAVIRRQKLNDNQ